MIRLMHAYSNILYMLK